MTMIRVVRLLRALVEHPQEVEVEVEAGAAGLAQEAKVVEWLPPGLHGVQGCHLENALRHRDENGVDPEDVIQKNLYLEAVLVEAHLVVYRGHEVLQAIAAILGVLVGRGADRAVGLQPMLLAVPRVTGVSWYKLKISSCMVLFRNSFNFLASLYFISILDIYSV
mmetsp:Transcript_16716/g.16914  ORF Transcript_16716/g.16914 Transcript_16716/m.16914 type:complete len:165 (+) Transcript_16716:1675-2169(+)